METGVLERGIILQQKVISSFRNQVRDGIFEGSMLKSHKITVFCFVFWNVRKEKRSHYERGGNT